MPEKPDPNNPKQALTYMAQSAALPGVDPTTLYLDNAQTFSITMSGQNCGAVADSMSRLCNMALEERKVMPFGILFRHRTETLPDPHSGLWSATCNGYVSFTEQDGIAHLLSEP